MPFGKLGDDERLISGSLLMRGSDPTAQQHNYPLNEINQYITSSVQRNTKQVQVGNWIMFTKQGV